jgi:hypothetical protein
MQALAMQLVLLLVLLLQLQMSLRSPRSLEPEDDFVAHAEDPISSSGDEFDD